MGRLIKTLENRTALVFFAVSAVLCAVTFGVCLWAVSYSSKDVQTQVCEHMLAAAGRLSQSGELTDEQIARAFTQGDKSYIKAG